MIYVIIQYALMCLWVKDTCIGEHQMSSIFRLWDVHSYPVLLGQNCQALQLLLHFPWENRHTPFAMSSSRLICTKVVQAKNVCPHLFCFHIHMRISRTEEISLQAHMVRWFIYQKHHVQMVGHRHHDVLLYVRRGAQYNCMAKPTWFAGEVGLTHIVS